MTPIVYIAGPYAAPTPEGVAENVRRAVALGRLALAAGACPIVPHVLGASGLYGDPHEADDGTSRANALRCGVAMSRTVAMAGGWLWAIEREDGTLSSGTELEVKEFGDYRDPGFVVRMPWSNWEGTWLHPANEPAVGILFPGRCP